MYSRAEWRRLVVLVTAFTVGHSITLALATLDLVRVNSAVIEALIPVTIVATGMLNIGAWRRYDGAGDPPTERTGQQRLKYLLALGFGLIHGLGFSNFLRSVLGAEESITVPLLAFNVGLEIGQLAIVAVVLLVSSLVTGPARWARRDWVLVLSAAITGVALVMAMERI